MLQLECCGSTDWTDYYYLEQPIPDECREKDTGNIVEFGCDVEFSRYLEPRTGTLSGLALLLVVLQVEHDLYLSLNNYSIREMMIDKQFILFLSNDQILAVIAMLVMRWAVLRDERQLRKDNNKTYKSVHASNI